MHLQLAISVLVLAIANQAVAKDRPVTDDERAKLVAAVAALQKEALQPA